ncbi:MAG: hypothetical protein ICV78_10970 [Tolypothrix sp. Co-bin9]|nr:hypothetical protein [Tolypothrix sp. Co-bin9]
MKAVLKDKQVSMRLSSEVAEQMREAALAEGLSMADFVTKMFQERNRRDGLEERLEALERAVFHQSQSAA